MRSLSALFAFAAFALGLAAGGRVPRAAAAAPAAPAPAASTGLDWKTDGKSLTLTNGSSDLAFLAIGKLRKAGLAAPAPAQSTGQVKIPIGDVNSLVVYRLQAALLCGANGCRPCLPPLSRVSDCPIPPPIPIGAERYQVNLGPRGAGRP